MEMKNVGKIFSDPICGGPKVEAVKDLNLSISFGEVICLVGKNGSGKTTTTRMMVGALKPSSGSIGFHGSRFLGRAICDSFGYCPEKGLWKYVTVEEHLILYATIKGVRFNHIKT